MKFQKNVLLKNHTTFKIGGPAKYFFIAKTKKDLIKAVSLAEKQNLPFFVLGGGSNLLVADEGYNGLVIKIKNQKSKIKNTNQKSKIIESESGASLGQLVALALKNSLSGLEWAAGIPGAVGGAVRGNAGAFGGEIKDIVSRVEVFDIRHQKIRFLKNKDCQYGYRKSIFKESPNLIILSAELKLKKGNKEKIKEKMQEHLNYRKKLHPAFPSAGSVFKNVELGRLPEDFFEKFPEARNVVKESGVPAAYLIDRCGLKGKKAGSAQVASLHPNFITNLGGAKARNVSALINLIKRKVREKFGIRLEEEIQVIHN